eukprot:COSAG06_NODE_103_length_23904_cov_10.413401_22_plen_40_part_00
MGHCPDLSNGKGFRGAEWPGDCQPIKLCISRLQVMTMQH